MKVISAIALTLLLTACGGGSTDGAPAAGQTRLLTTTSVNIAFFSGLRDTYSITRTSAGFNVVNRLDGSATPVTGVTRIEFADMSLNTGVGELSKSIAAADLKTLVELYTAFFNRIPDADGMSFWIGECGRGVSLEAIADSFYSVAISQEFSALTGYAPDMSNAAFIGIIYKNVLGRDKPDDGGLDFWSKELASGRQTRGSLVRSILGSAHGYKGDPAFGFVADLLDNKYAVGSFFAVQQGLTFKNNVFQQSAAISAAVTPTDSTAAMQKTGVFDTSFNLLVAAPTIDFNAVQAIITKRCAVCHAAKPTQPGYQFPPAGVVLTSSAQIHSLAENIYKAAVVNRIMPFGNLTGMTEAERATIGEWFLAGAP